MITSFSDGDSWLRIEWIGVAEWIIVHPRSLLCYFLMSQGMLTNIQLFDVTLTENKEGYIDCQMCSNLSGKSMSEISFWGSQSSDFAVRLRSTSTARRRGLGYCVWKFNEALTTKERNCEHRRNKLSIQWWISAFPKRYVAIYWYTGNGHRKNTHQTLGHFPVYFNVYNSLPRFCRR